MEPLKVLLHQTLTLLLNIYNSVLLLDVSVKLSHGVSVYIAAATLLLHELAC